MTRKEERRFFGENVLPLILGGGIRAHLLSLKIYKTFGIPSLLCASRKNPLFWVNPKCGFLQLSFKPHGSAAPCILSDLADEYNGYKTLLISVSSKGNEFIGANQELLEARYVTLLYSKRQRNRRLKSIIIPER